jgi:hypothetical protein
VLDSADQGELALVDRDEIPFALTQVDLPRSGDLLLRISQQLLPLGKPTDL